MAWLWEDAGDTEDEESMEITNTKVWRSPSTRVPDHKHFPSLESEENPSRTKLARYERSTGYKNFFTQHSKRKGFYRSLSDAYFVHSYRDLQLEHIINEHRMKQIMFRYSTRSIRPHIEHFKEEKQPKVSFGDTEQRNTQPTQVRQRSY